MVRAYCLFLHMSHDMRFPTMWYVRPAKAPTSLRIRAVWSEPLLVAWILYDYLATDRTAFEVSKLKRRLHRLVWVNTCQNATLLDITCHGNIYLTDFKMINHFKYSFSSTHHRQTLCKIWTHYIKVVKEVWVTSYRQN